MNLLKALTQPFIRYPLLAIVGLYGFLTIPHLDKGLSSLDGHGTIASVNRSIEDGVYTPSRKPGHPSTEVYTYLPIAYCMKVLTGQSFTWFTYSILQWIGGLICLISFYLLLRTASSSQRLITIGTLSFTCCHSFISNSIDGTEFNWALTCIFTSLRLIILSFRHNQKNPLLLVIISGVFASIATGYRQEFVFFLIVYPILFKINPSIKFEHIYKSSIIPIIVGFVIWLPVLIHNHFTLPLPMPMPDDGLTEIGNRTLGGSYKLIFLGLTLPVCVILIGWLVRLIESYRKFLNSDKETLFIYLSSTLLSLLFTSSYFIYPFKPDFIILILPLLILLAVSVNWNTEIYCLGSAILLSLIVQIDIFEDRRLVSPHIQSSLYWQKVLEKPHYKKERLQKEIGQVAGKHKVLLVTDLWSTDFDYLMARDMLPFDKLQKKHDRNFELYESPDSKSLLRLSSRRAIEDLQSLLEIQNEGYEICISQKFLRSFFFKYDIRFPIGDKITVGKVYFTVI